jgi:DNA mismatch endonuclease, patch repair protein
MGLVHDPRRRVPKPSSAQAEVRMRASKQRDTAIEIALRSELHARNLRFRLHHKLPELRGAIDIAFPRSRVAIFVDGCFWHFCPVHKTIPKANREWWLNKLKTNRARDQKISRRLIKSGWIVFRVWEHENMRQVAKRIEPLVRSRSASLASRTTRHPRP